MNMILDALVLAATDPWTDEFFGLDQNQRFVAILTILGCGTGIVITLAAFIYAAFDAAHRRRTEADLKREMLDRGMSVDEAVKIIEAAPPPEDDFGRWISCWGKGRKK